MKVIGILLFILTINIYSQEYQYLDIPTSDNIKSVTHASVIYSDSKWGGYNYWMTYTPYPDAARENPDIIASNDGIHWTQINGLLNPIIPLKMVNSLGFSYNSDPDIVFVRDTLFLYCRIMYPNNNNSNKDEIIVLTKIDSNGIKSAPMLTNLYTNADNKYEMLSPAVIYEDNKLKMWVVNDAADENSNRVVSYSSYDGLNWGEKRVCIVPRDIKLWHIDIVSAFNKYWMLGLIKDTYNLILLSSENGVEWEKSNNIKIVKPDSMRCFYKSAFIPIDSPTPKFQVWPVFVGRDGSGVFNSTHSIWRQNREILAGEIKDSNDNDLFDNTKIFPNPFNSNTNLSIKLKKSSVIKYSIYNLTGELVKNYDSSVELNAGNNILNINMDGLSTGIYFLRIYSRDFIINKKLLLLK